MKQALKSHKFPQKTSTKFNGSIKLNNQNELIVKIQKSENSTMVPVISVYYTNCRAYTSYHYIYNVYNVNVIMFFL